jgi:hypothetical protein
MGDNYEVSCLQCGSRIFRLEFTGIHIKAYCNDCNKLVRNAEFPYFIKTLEDNYDDEEATPKQIASIKYRAYHECYNLSKTDAGDIIGIYERAKKEE